MNVTRESSGVSLVNILKLMALLIATWMNLTMLRALIKPKTNLIKDK